jgi:cobalamin synthase
MGRAWRRSSHAAREERMLQPVRFVRLVGIAIGSIVAAWLVMWLVGWILPQSLIPFAGLATLVLGGLIYNDIRRRDRRGS